MTTPSLNNGQPPMGVESTSVDNGLQRPETVDWDEVHRLIQQTFDELANRVCHEHAEIRARAGRTVGGCYYLFSYCDFDIPSDHAIRAVAAGVDFQKGPGHDQVTVRGDIVQEETGDVLFETEQRVVSLSRNAVLATAAEFSRTLGEQAAVIIGGLDQPSVPETNS
jgi:hypothetical protein